MSQQQAQIDALEHLVLALYKALDEKDGVAMNPIIDRAKATLLGSDGPGGPEQKSAAAGYLENLASRMKEARHR